MDTDAWQTLLAALLVTNAALGLGYRIYRRTKGGPKADVWGQAVLAVLLLAIAAGIVSGIEWLQWAALGYSALFAFVAMPVWVLGILLPMRPRALDYAFTVTYWLVLFAIGVAAILV